MAGIITFEQLIEAVSAEKVFLAEIEPRVRVQGWSVHSGSIYKATVGHLDPSTLAEDGTAMTEVASVGLIGAGDWHYENGVLYAQPTSGTPYSKLYVLTYYGYFATKAMNVSDRFYEPLLLTGPRVSQKLAELSSGVSIIADGSVQIGNDRGELDDRFYDHDWMNATVRLKVGGEDLPYSEYQSVFTGVVSRAEFQADRLTLYLTDAKRVWESPPVLNRFDDTTYPNIKAENIGKPIPQIFGTVYSVRVINVDETIPNTTTGTYRFKLADTSTYGISSISAVYVDGVSVAFTDQKESGQFSLATATYVPGNTVTADAVGYTSSAVVLENPVDILKAIASNSFGVAYASAWDTATTAIAHGEAASFPCGLLIADETPALDIAALLMRSCLGNFYTNNDGEYACSVWDTTQPETPDVVDEIDMESGSLRAEREEGLISKTVRIGWRRKWDVQEKDAYATVASSDDDVEQRYGITREMVVNTLLSTSAGAQTLLSRLAFIYTGAITLVSFNCKLQLALKNVGDRIEVRWRRRTADDYPDWIAALAAEVQSIEKDYGSGITRLLVNDLRGVGDAVGHWTADPPVFPNVLGGAQVTGWDSAWNASQKAYAKQHWGFWCDADGLADSNDAESLHISRFW